MTKAELRKSYLRKRSLLSEAEYLKLSHQLCENFFASVDLSFIDVLHMFIPIEKNKEPNTWLIIDRIRREFANIRLTVPRINTQTGEMENFFFEGLKQLKPNAWGIMEPVSGVPVENNKVDAVLVPLLAFDQRGHRVGYGKGFYDKFLAQVNSNCKMVGLSFFPPVDTIDDVAKFDIRLHLCITPAQAYSFGAN